MKHVVESGIFSGNDTGKVGDAIAIPFGRGYMQSGGNNGSAGIQFTPSSEPTFKNYKQLKHKKKKEKKMKNVKNFEEFINEDSAATAGNTGGMGAVVAAQPSSTPGSVEGSTIGSGDIGQAIGNYTKPKLILNKSNKKRKKITSLKNLNNNNLNENTDEFYEGSFQFETDNEIEEIDNFTARYYDNYDDEDSFEDDIYDENIENVKRIQLYENYISKSEMEKMYNELLKLSKDYYIEIKKLRKLDETLFGKIVKDLYNSNNKSEIMKFIDYLTGKIFLSQTQFLHQKIYMIDNSENLIETQIELNYKDLDKKIEKYKKQQDIVDQIEDKYRSILEEIIKTDDINTIRFFTNALGEVPSKQIFYKKLYKLMNNL